MDYTVKEILTLLIGAAELILSALVVLIFWYCVGGHLYRDEDEEEDIIPAQPPRRQRRVVDWSAGIEFDVMGKESDMQEKGGGCAICLEEYEVGEARGRITSCGHRFHAGCIMVWLAEQDSCPLCRSSAV